MADYQRPGGLRTAGQDGAAAQGQGLPGAVPLNESAELLADLLGATGLLTADKLASARARAGQGSLVQALRARSKAGPKLGSTRTSAKPLPTNSPRASEGSHCSLKRAWSSACQC